MEKELERVTARITSIDCICRCSTRADPLFATIDYIDTRTKKHRFALFANADWELKSKMDRAEAFKKIPSNDDRISIVKTTIQKVLINNELIDLVLARRESKDNENHMPRYDYVIKIGEMKSFGI